TLVRLAGGFGVSAAELLTPPPPPPRATGLASPRAAYGADPLGALLDALEVDARPPAAWMLQWSHPGADPLRRARNSHPRNCLAMLRLLLHAGERAAWLRAVDAVRGVAFDAPPGYDARCCAAIRATVTAPPALAELLARLGA